MKKEGNIKAAVRMPDGEYISVGGSLILSGGADESETDASEDAKSASLQSEKFVFDIAGLISTKLILISNEREGCGCAPTM